MPQNTDIQQTDLHKLVVMGLKQAIAAHGAITPDLVGSAAKRITALLLTEPRMSGHFEVPGDEFSPEELALSERIAANLANRPPSTKEDVEQLAIALASYTD